MSTLSQTVVQFIANLHPLYIGEVYEGVQAARCIEDGTLVFPVEEDKDYEDGIVRVCWQGIKPNSSELPGATYASIAVQRYVALVYAAHRPEVQRAQLLFYARHFMVKTGLPLHFDEPSELDEVLCKLIEMSKSAGSTALAVLLKSKLGI